ncbi:M48 family metallopeptidase [Fulvivirga lutimaris]|uniref:M48 family metallopeptidase n=1 Tax=Fulvivirga lutimaris TaxID=1819566 RepID=UPI0012BCA3A4|nr:M48 family metallopeptidase [Fulvivirga lutimaris]MTI38793.1 M48 family peptidase [Fulvivirga lutimaris]
MTSQTILFLILGIITFSYLLNQVLDYLNLKSRKSELPEDIKSFYNEEKYAKAQEYHKTLSNFSFLTSAFSFLGSFAVLYFGGFGFLDQLLRPMVGEGIVLSLSYFGVLFILSDILNLPFSIYSTFVIEERFGFNKTTPKTFIVDKLKGYVLTVIVGGLLIGSLLYLINNIGESFWLYFWAIAGVFILFVNMFYTSLILPLFNKLTPLEDGELKTAIEDYSQKIDFPLDNIYVIDGSKRSNKANAFFSGIGKRKKIVLYDTLINNHSIEELVAVLAHEVGHFKKKHVIYGFAISILQIGLMLFIMSQMIYSEAVSQALGGQQLAIHLNLLAFGILYSPISMISSILGNILSRKNEFEADAYARLTYKPEALQEALKKLSVDNLSNLYPHPAYVFLHYSHPPLLQRLNELGKA